MGLDQYASIRLDTKHGDGVNYDLEEIAYWRKHPNLQGFMEALYYEKGGNAGQFNCVPLELTIEDIDNLEMAIMEGGLPETVGFFFGDNSDDHYTEQDLEFVDNARKALAEGKSVIYDSWW